MLIRDLGAGLSDIARGGQWQWIAGVPTSSRRRCWRGYCGPELLAEVVGESLGLPVLREFSCLGDPAPRKSLRTLSTRRSERVQFASGRVRGAGLLVDDVVTSGQTLFQARQALLTAGAERVDLLCLARSPEARCGRSSN